MDVQASPGSVRDPRLSAAPVSPAASNKVCCEECGASFSRREHLQRHKRSHTNERPYTCSKCGNAFSRMDVLAKHAESHNQKASTPSRVTKAFPRACLECANIRIRCPRGDPCQRCSDRGLRCTYPTARKRKASRVTAEDVAGAIVMESAGEVAESSQEPGDGTINQDDSSAPIATSTRAITTMGSGDDHLASAWEMGQTTEVSVQPFTTSNNQDSFPGDPALESLGAEQITQNMDWFALNWLSPADPAELEGFDQAGFAIANAQQAEGPYALFPYPYPSSLAPGDQWAWPASAPAFDRAAPAINTSPASGQAPEGRAYASDPMDQAAVNDVEESPVSGATPATLYVDGGASRAPFKGLAAQRGVNVEDENSEVGSGIEQSVTGHLTKGVLSPQAAENILNGIRNSVSLEQLRGGCFPSLHQLQTFFRMYFRYFHPSFPFLRPDPLFYDDVSRWPLALAVCATGAQYCSKSENALTRHFLCEVLHQVATTAIDHALSDTENNSPFTNGSPDGSSESQLFRVQATVLDLICHYYAADHPPIQSTSVSQFKLIQACRKMGLLDRRGQETGFSTSQDVDTAAVELWTLQQSRLRTGFMIWLLDSILSMECETGPFLSLGDIQCSLPCREHVWESATEITIMKEGTDSVDFLDAMEMLYIEKKLPRGLDAFSTIIMVHVIIQRTKAVVKQYQTGLASWVPSASSQKRAPSRRVEETWPPCLPILSKWRNSACDCLDVLHWNANSISARDGGWEPFTIFHLHLSRLILLTPVGPLRVLATGFQSGPSMSSQKVDAIQTARSKLLRWAAGDQYKARLAVIHAGALFWHVRRYSINSFVEPLGIYLATLVLWGYSTASIYISENTTAHDEIARRQAAQPHDGSGRPDLSPNPTASVRTMSPLSGMDEDPEGMQFYVDRPCDDEIVQAYVKYGRKMSGRLSQVGDLCQVDAPRKILAQGERILEARQRTGKQRGGDGSITSPSGAGSPVTWGITTHYLKILRDFSQAKDI